MITDDGQDSIQFDNSSEDASPQIVDITQIKNLVVSTLTIVDDEPVNKSSESNPEQINNEHEESSSESTFGQNMDPNQNKTSALITDPSKLFNSTMQSNSEIKQSEDNSNKFNESAQSNSEIKQSEDNSNKFSESAQSNSEIKQREGNSNLLNDSTQPNSDSQPKTESNVFFESDHHNPKDFNSNLESNLEKNSDEDLTTNHDYETPLAAIRKSPSQYDGRYYFADPDNFFDDQKVLVDSMNSGVRKSKTQPIRPLRHTRTPSKRKRLKPIHTIAHSQISDEEFPQIDEHKPRKSDKIKTRIFYDHDHFSVKIFIPERKQTEMTLVLDKDNAVSFDKPESKRSPTPTKELHKRLEPLQKEKKTNLKQSFQNKNNKVENDELSIENESENFKKNAFGMAQRAIHISNDDIPKPKTKRRSKSVAQKKKGNSNSPKTKEINQGDDKTQTIKPKRSKSVTRQAQKPKPKRVKSAVIQSPKASKSNAIKPIDNDVKTIGIRKRKVSPKPKEYQPPKEIFDVILSSANSAFWNAAINHYYTISI